ncbi:MAG: hypothetical protein ACR2M1_05860 [Gemmatimonadaceae bacterium]
MVPASDAQSSGVDVATVADGKIVARERIDATSQKYARTRDGCNGVESADWSADGRRVYLRSDYTCPGSIRRTSTGVFAISPAGEWVDVEGIATGAGKGVRTLRYDDAGAPAGLPSEIASAISGRALAVNAARTADAAPITAANIVEATHKLDPAVVEAWLVDRGQGFSINARQLIDLADAGVPSNVTDAMVALSYPRSFAVDSAQYAGGAVDGASGALGARGYRTGRNVDVFINPSYPVGYGYSRYGYSPYDRYSPYGYYSPYSAYGRAYGGWYGVPAVIVLKGNQPTDAQSTGRLVKGRGYTQSDPGNAASAGSAHPRPSPSAGSSTSAEGRSSGSGSESTSGSGRTAKPRP